MTGTRQSLTEFAAARGNHHSAKAWMDTLPPEVLAECVEGWKVGLGMTVIFEWLLEQGFKEATKGKIQQYLSSRYPRG